MSIWLKRGHEVKIEENLSISASLDEEILERARTTAFPSPLCKNDLSSEEKVEAIATHFREIMKVLGLDVTDAALKETPRRVANMYVNEVFTGLDPATFPRICLFDDQFQAGEQSNLVFMKVNFSSFCEHHFVPMNGIASIAYIPRGKLFGFSTLPRLVQHFAKRPQLQERLTAQIADAIRTLSGSDDVAVSLKAQHQCMVARATESEDSFVVTHCLLGSFEYDPERRREFLEYLVREQ